MQKYIQQQILATTDSTRSSAVLETYSPHLYTLCLKKHPRRF